MYSVYQMLILDAQNTPLMSPIFHFTGKYNNSAFLRKGILSTTPKGISFTLTIEETIVHLNKGAACS